MTNDFEEQLREQSLELYEPIRAELTDPDKRSLLMIQRFVRERGSYVYLEIGSHLGGSIQPHLRDPKCSSLYSIDPRPAIQNDTRGSRFGYADNSTQRMLEGLAKLAPTRVSALRTFDMDASKVDLEGGPKADLVFIDGEHTDSAALSDARASMRFAAADAMVVFHDAPIVYEGISEFVEQLDSISEFSAFALPDNLFVVAFGRAGRHLSANISLTMTGTAYLQALRANSGYRTLRKTPAVRIAFGLMRRLGAGHIVSRYEYGSHHK